MDQVLRAKTALLPSGWANDVAVRIADGRIADVVMRDRDMAPNAVTVDILLPSPANLHSHAFQRAMAGLTETRTGEQDSFWTWRTLMYRFLEALSPDDVQAIAAHVYVEMLEAGYAAVGEFHYLHHGLSGTSYDDPAEMSSQIAAAAVQTGIGLTHLPVLYMRGGTDGRPLEGGQLRFGCEMDRFLRLLEGAETAVAQVSTDATTGVAAHSLRAVGVEALTDAAQLRTDKPFHIHIAEQSAEVVDVLASHGATPIEWLLENMNVGPRWCLIHATHMSPAEVKGLATSGAVAGLCPITEANLGDGTFEAGSFMQEGGTLGVGSDSNIRISLSGELRTLEYGQRLRDRARAVLSRDGSTGRTVFDAACRGGAQALGRRSGAIEAGSWADLVALDSNALALEGLQGDTVLDSWIFAGDDRVISDVWSAGRHVVQDGRHIRRDAIEARFREVLSRLRAI
ncbi:MAG: formimidoylglutamate deiminase [Pseudomonadota bacterium]